VSTARLAPSELLAELSRRGVTLIAAGSRLQVTASRGALTPELRQQLSAQKPILLALLTAAQRADAGALIANSDASPIGPPAACSELPDGAPTQPSFETADALRANLIAPGATLRIWLERYGHFAPASSEPLWADPRPDLTGDHVRWSVLLALAWNIDGWDPYGIYGALSGVRCCGAALVTDVQPLDLTPEGPPLRWRLTRGEIPEPEWRSYRARWLWPHKETLVKLLQGGREA
jgi:hypothetical protein